MLNLTYMACAHACKRVCTQFLRMILTSILKSIKEDEGEKNHKKGGLNCVFKNFSFLRFEKLFPDSESEIV